MAPLPEAALKEKAYRQLVSLAALERLEPGKHVAVPGRGDLSLKQWSRLPAHG